MFLNNKYTNCYFSIINNAKSQTRIKLDRKNVNFIYYEYHHIIPKCIGGSDEEVNIVALTAKEHYICHLLLTKMSIKKDNQLKLIKAFVAMTGYNKGTKSRYKSNSYHIFKNRINSIISENNKGEHNPNYGNKWSEQQKINASILKKQHGRNPITKLKMKCAKKDLRLCHRTKYLVLLSPSNEYFVVVNLNFWCKENNIPYWKFYNNLIRFKKDSYNGFKLVKEDYLTNLNLNFPIYNESNRLLNDYFIENNLF